MARVSTYLNFPGTCEAAFNFYRTLFGGDFLGPVSRFDTAPPNPDHPLSDADRRLIMHIELPILGGHVLMGSDAPPSMGFRLTSGDQTSLNLETDTREEARRLFEGLAEGGHILMPLQDMFWGALFGHVRDRFGILWMVNCASAP
jgi:PhnB protein